MKGEMPLILIVDDSPMNLSFIDNILRNNNYKTATAANGSDAIEYLSKNSPDVILLDIILPDVSGYDICKAVRSNAETESIPIIFISSKSSPDEIQKGLRIGGSDYLIKPFNEIELLARIDNHYKFKKSQDKLKALNEELLRANQIIAKKNKALEKALHQLERLATTDALTNLYNRRFIMSKINEEILRYKRSGKVFSFLLCDIDHFKSINDEYGHNFGDYCLKELSRTVLKNVREQDTVSRWGGEEFLILLVETGKEEAGIVAERIRSEIQGLTLKHNGIQTQMNVTIGVSEYDSALEVKDCIKTADKALYQGKANGRNQVVIL